MTAQYGGTDCRDIARVDWSDREAAKDYYNNPDSRRAICINLVGDVAMALCELLDAETAGGKG